MAKWATVSHDFPGVAVDAVFWPASGGTPTVASNEIRFAAAAGTHFVQSVTHDLDGSSIVVRMDTSGNGTAQAQVVGSGLSAGFGVYSNQLWTYRNSSGQASIPYVVASHQWWRFRAAGEHVYGDVGPTADGPWTNIFDYTSPGATFTATALQLIGANSPNAGATNNRFSKLNVLPAAAPQPYGFPGSALSNPPIASSFGTIAVGGGRMQITHDVNGGMATTQMDLNKGPYTLEVVRAPGAQISWSYRQPGAAWGDFADTDLSGGTLSTKLFVGGVATGTVNLTYDPVAHRFLRLAIVGGNFVWSASPNGRAWTVINTVAVPGAWTWLQNGEMGFGWNNFGGTTYLSRMNVRPSNYRPKSRPHQYIPLKRSRA